MIFNFRRKNKPGELHEMPDHELIQAYRKEENPEMISELFIRYTHLVYGICLKYFNDKEEAKDAVMEIFEGLITGIPEHEIRNFKNWLFSVSRNHCLMLLRKKKMIQFADDSFKENNEGIVVESLDEMHQDKTRQEYAESELIIAMNQLKDEQRICLELVYLKEKSYQEVGEITGYTINEVKSYVQNGKRNLKIKLESLNEEKE